MTKSISKYALLLALVPAGLSSVVQAQEATQEATVTAPKTWSYSGNYTADFIGVVSGGVERGSRYLDNFGLQLNYDGTAHGLKGITATVGLLYNNQSSISELVSDIQGISNIETGTAALRPYETWIAKTWGDDQAILKAGLIDLNGTFDAPGVSALFLNPSHGINPTFSQTGASGPSIFPILGLAVVGEVELYDSLRVRTGAFDAVPGDPDQPERTDLAWRQSDGALLVGEAEYQRGKMRAVAGIWGYTQASQALLLRNGSARNNGIYGTLEYVDDANMSYFVRAGMTDKELNFTQSYLAAGLIVTGPLKFRKSDQLGIAIAHARISSDVVASGLTDEAETNIELTYAAPISEALSLQGDVQYIANPAGGLFARRALVVGMRVKYAFGS